MKVTGILEDAYGLFHLVGATSFRQTNLQLHDSVQVSPAASVRDLGVYLDSNMHVTRLVCTCFGILRQTRSIISSTVNTVDTHLQLRHVKLDYCNVAVAGLSAVTWTVSSPSSTLPHA